MTNEEFFNDPNFEVEEIESPTDEKNDDKAGVEVTDKEF